MCSTYDINIMNCIIPPLNLFYTLCYPSDKTYLFISGIIRIILIILIYLCTYKNEQLTKLFINKILLSYLILNIILQIFIILKKQKYQTEEHSILTNNDLL